jgi:hypothetical protein
MFGALVLIAGSLAAPAVAAQDAGGDYSLDIIPAGDAIAAIPDGSVRVAVTSADGSVDYGSCMLSMDTKPAGCSVMVPAGTAVTVALDDSTLPEGIGVVEATQQYTTPAEKTQVGDVWFEFTWVTDGDDDAEAPEDDRDVRELPATGAGPTDAGNRATLAAASGLLAIATLAGALTARLMRQR